MKALTIWQPWAHFIANGEKRVENRDWRPPKDLVGGYLAIHAGKRYDKQGADWIRVEFAGVLNKVVPAHAELPQGAIVAVAVVDRVVDSADDSPGWDDPWFVGAFGWYLRDVVRIEPVACNGAQKLWNVPERVLHQVRANFKTARAA